VEHDAVQRVSAPALEECPYPGLAPFQRDDARWFSAESGRYPLGADERLAEPALCRRPRPERACETVRL